MWRHRPQQRISSRCAGGQQLSGAIPKEYPIATFLNTLMAGRSRDEFVRSLGYWKRIDRGRHRLDLWIDDGNGQDKIISQIAAAYPDAAPELKTAVEATMNVKSGGP
jgi:hypothetical protein